MTTIMPANDSPLSPDAPWAMVLDGRGAGHLVSADTVGSVIQAGGLVWMHIAETSAAASRLGELISAPDKVVGFFGHPPDQPRLVAVGDGLIMTLRGVEMPSGVADFLMPSIKLWFAPGRLVTAGSPMPQAVREIRADLQAGAGPTGPADFLGRLALLLIRDLGPLLDGDSEALDLLETRVLTRQADQLGRELGQIRLRLLRLHRHLSPQRTLLHELLQEHGRHRAGTGEALATLREASERVDDRLERLEGLREHCGALQDSLADLQSQRMNNALYLLSLYTALFLPMGVLTGLLGINLAGIPGEKSPWGFWVVCLILAFLGVVGYWVFVKIGLLKPVSDSGSTGGPAPEKP